MKIHNTRLNFPVGLVTAALFAIGATAQAADQPTLKDAYKDHFYVGVAINRTIPTASAVKADNVDRNMDQVFKDIAVVKQQFSQISPENDLKWALIHPREGKDGYDFAPADAYVNFGLSNHMFIVGHTLVWHGQTPSWVFAGTNPPPPAPTNATAGRFGGRRGFNGPRASREELLQRMHDHIQTVVGRYKGKVQCWDVVNEALADGGTNILRSSQWSEIIGPDFIAKAFEYAHEADPNAILRYNDYSLENSAKRKKCIELIKSLQAQHIPVGAIGTQTHIGVGTKFEDIDKELTELETLGLPIHITELDINSSERGQRSTSGEVGSNVTGGALVDNANTKLAEAYANLFRALVKHEKYVKVVTFWGVNDGVSWRADGKPLLFDAQDQPKPAFDAVLKVVNGDQAVAK